MATIRTRKRGRTYSYIFEAGQVNGKRKTVEKGGFKTKEAAYNAGVEAYADFKHGNIGIVSDHITLKDSGCMAWLQLMFGLLPYPSTKR
ncbi:AP2-like DNA-binding integrase domain-containing protein [Selenomonas ruminantium]|uniref:AP2-like DNA-binding integrase domain-containing protein n=1 Tax=Selenomonas ruminantium TaxID=971 RepID=A0A1M6WP70_SELRU|nr:Arm DNA-binding domain-containing protein [Selenomonas ruminantium]SHK95399.1 AP2-like DNA-binding integrase domain-containing protein [Selenomonas ruminantium]